MMRDVRTTLNVDDELLVKAKEVAARTGRPLGEVVDDALRVLFAERPAASRKVRLPVDGSASRRPLVDLDDKEAVAEALGDNRPPSDSA